MKLSAFSSLACRCPACGEGGLYEGLLTVRERCPHCRLLLRRGDTGDGAPYFIIITLGTLVTALAVWVEFRFAPDPWVHLLLWPPVILGGSILMLRVIKAWLIASQYEHRRELFDE